MNSNKTEGRTSCGEVRPRLGKYLAGELDADESASVRTHLDECRGCEDALFVCADQRRAAEPAPEARHPLSGSASTEAFRGFTAAHRGWIGPVINRLRGPALRGEVWAQDDFENAQMELREASGLWPSRVDAHLGGIGAVLGSEAPNPIIVTDENCQEVTRLSDFRIVEEPTMTKAGRFRFTVHLPSPQYEGWDVFCTLHTHGKAVTFSGAVENAGALDSNRRVAAAEVSTPQVRPSAAGTPGTMGDASALPAVLVALRDRAVSLVPNLREVGEIRIDEPDLGTFERDMAVPLEDIDLYLMPPVSASNTAATGQ